MATSFEPLSSLQPDGHREVNGYEVLLNNDFLMSTTVMESEMREVQMGSMYIKILNSV